MNDTLEGRKARCGLCRKERDSTDHESLAFFEYRGPGSRYALEKCGVPGCGYHECAHQDPNPATGRPGPARDHTFIPNGGHEYDSYYCGCRGWD